MALQPYYASQHRASTSALVPSSYSHQNPWFYQTAASAAPSTVHDNGNAAGPSRYVRGDAVAFRHKSATIRPPYQYVNNINAPPASSSSSSSSTPSSSDYDDDSEDEDSETDASSVAPEPPAKPSLKSSSQVVLVPFRESHPQSAFSPLSSRSAHSGGPYSNNNALTRSALSRSATDLSSHLVSARSRTISLAAAAAPAPAPARSVVGSSTIDRVLPQPHRHVEPPQPPHSLHRRSNTVSHVSAPPTHRSAFHQVQVQAPSVHLAAAPPAIVVSEQQQMYNYVHAMQSLERVADVDPRLLSRPASPARKPSLVRRIAQAWRGRRRTLERVRFESVIPGSPNYNGSSGPFELYDEEDEEEYQSEVGTHFEAAPHVVGMAYSQTGYRRARIVIE